MAEIKKTKQQEKLEKANEQLLKVQELLIKGIQGNLSIDDFSEVAESTEFIKGLIEENKAKIAKVKDKTNNLKQREDLNEIAKLVEGKILSVLDNGKELSAEEIRQKVTVVEMLPDSKGNLEENNVIKYKTEDGEDKVVKVNKVARMTNLLNKLVKADKLKVTLDGNTKLYSKK